MADEFQSFTGIFQLGSRLPELPKEFYEPTILAKIGTSIGKFLRVDNATIAERGASLQGYAFRLIWKNLLNQFYLWKGKSKSFCTKVLESFALPVEEWVIDAKRVSK